MRLFCTACNRSVPMLVEILVVELGHILRVVRCQDCMELAQKQLAMMAKAEVN